MAPAFVRGSYKVEFVLSILVIVLVVGAVGAVGYADVRDTVRSDTEETLRSASAADAEATSEGFALANTVGQTVVFIVADSAQFSAAVSELAEDSYVGTLSMLRLRSLPESVNLAGGRG